jgi:predicted ATP-dependent endonuclease of OLD family
MKINSFHIKNYRSIVDSANCYLSPDCITALIGQNESGKTSVLEALISFYEGQISDDILRSDLTFPEISCTFTLDEGKVLGDYLDLSGIPVELRDKISGKKELTLNRKWINSRKSQVNFDDQELLEYFDTLEHQKQELEKKIASSTAELTRQTETSARETEAVAQSVAEARNDLNNLYGRFEELKKALSKARKPDEQVTLQQEIDHVQQQLAEAENQLKEKLLWFEKQKTDMQLLAEKLSACKTYNDLSLQLEVLHEETRAKTSLLKEAEHQLEGCFSEKDRRLMVKRIEQLKDQLGKATGESNTVFNQLSLKRRIADKLLSGKKYSDAESEAWREQETENGYATPEDIGNALFKKIPVFQFFEDFSSLLPNKIDLDDLLNENVHAEGYKAARNFLSVAGLNADFFREKNHRILKQKIENLNSEITVDFQDYWRQQVGKDDKIRINFELEHYDNTQPEKSGKPYLEFWIKDKQERLYPKQRSRGVRWFLSFYLELKATAKENTIDRIMLIDEPGLSLHARAQEDVLKVFEDLRENLQIIYCTHSPNLIDPRKLYRIIAVQREKDTDEKSETIILDARSLSEASADTLSPIYALMGARLNDRQFIFPKNNIIVEDAVTFHYLDAMAKLFGMEGKVHFIPSSGADHIALVANLLFGWKVDFGVLVMDTPANDQLTDHLKATTFFPIPDAAQRKIISFKGFTGIEDLFSTIDFKRYILQQRIGITMSNFEYIETHQLSRMILTSNFCSKIQKEDVQVKDFDEETQRNFENLFALIREMAE